jgi:hypothetical protein
VVSPGMANCSPGEGSYPGIIRPAGKLRLIGPSGVPTHLRCGAKSGPREPLVASERVIKMCVMDVAHLTSLRFDVTKERREKHSQ